MDLSKTSTLNCQNLTAGDGRRRHGRPPQPPRRNATRYEIKNSKEGACRRRVHGGWTAPTWMHTRSRRSPAAAAQRGGRMAAHHGGRTRGAVLLFVRGIGWNLTTWLVPKLEELGLRRPDYAENQKLVLWSSGPRNGAWIACGTTWGDRAESRMYIRAIRRPRSSKRCGGS